MKMAEGAKLQMCYLLHHLADIQLRHRVEAIIAFSKDFVGDLQAVSTLTLLSKFMKALVQKLPIVIRRNYNASVYEQYSPCLSLIVMISKQVCFTRQVAREFGCHSIGITYNRKSCFNLYTLLHSRSDSYLVGFLVCFFFILFFFIYFFRIS